MRFPPSVHHIASSGFALLSAIGQLLAAPQQPSDHRFAREGVLGTSSALTIRAPDRATAEQAAELVYATIASCDAALSLWRDDSELARLVAAGKGKASPTVLGALAATEQWRERTANIVAPGIATASQLWLAATASGFPPEPAALQEAARRAAEPAWTTAGEQVTFHHPFSLDAVAKGWILDRASRVLGELPKASLVLLQIGGDTVVGNQGCTVAVSDPRQPADNAPPLAVLGMRAGAVASSGGYARPFQVGIRKHSHILDPRTGQPCDDVLGASVVAANATTADALATAVCVLGPQEGFALLDRHAAHGIVVTRDGKVHKSRGFAALEVPMPTTAAPTASNWPDGFDLEVRFAIRAPSDSSGGRRGGWKRPYVAVWVEDATGMPARTLCLWIEDRRWLRDLRRWNRQHQNETGFAAAISQATRRAGQYTLRWDGKDDHGQPLAPGEYTIHLEAAREHGTYQIAKTTLTLRDTPQQAKLPDNVELGDITIDFGRHRP